MTDKVKEEKKENDVLREVGLYFKSKGLFFWRSNNIPVFGRNNAGAMVYRSMPAFSIKGVPDFICIYRGKFIGIEIKNKIGRLSNDQETFANLCHINGGRYYTVRSVKDAEKVLHEIQSKV